MGSSRRCSCRRGVVSKEAPADELPWLLGIARGVMADRRRGEARREALNDCLAATAMAEVELGPDQSTGESAVVGALCSLNKSDQEVLLLVAWDGLDRARAAQVLGVSSAVFALRLHRARRRLARALAAQGSVEQRTGEQPATEVL